MRYFEPIGAAADAPYVDESSGQEGSAVPAKAIEFPQREIMTVITGAGLSPDEGSVSQLEEAIDLKIANAVSSGGGGGGSPVDDLLTLLRSRNPVYPEVNTSDGTFNLTVVSAGNLQIPAGISITHRGCFNDVTSVQNLTTLANKTYHLRKNWTTGWALKDLADTGYNPGGALSEDNALFDTGYDDMLTHKVQTNGSNIATITPLKNKNDLSLQEVILGTNFVNSNTLNTLFDAISSGYNWARTPRVYDLTLSKWSAGREVQKFNIGPLGSSLSDLTNNAATFSFTRYRAAHTCWATWVSGIANMHLTARA